MSDTTALSAPDAGWYPDRNEANTVRWWDGQQWTDQTQTTAPAAVAFEQPVSVAAFAPSAAAAPTAAATAAAIAPGWYPDNYDATLQRWWDGTQWTPHTSAAASLAQSAGTQHVSARSNALATLAMVASIGSFAGLIFAPLLLLALVGIVVGIVAVVRVPKYAPGAGRRGQAIAGIVVGAVSLILTVVLTILAVLVYQQVHSTVGTQASGQQSNSTSAFPSTIGELKQTITKSVEQQDAVTVSTVSCDPAASMLAGSAFDCGVIAGDGRWSPIRVKILAATGSGMTYNLSLGPLLAHDEAAPSLQYTVDQFDLELSGDLAQAWGSPISDLGCDPAASMAEGSSFECDVTMATGSRGIVLIDMVAVDGYDVSVRQLPSQGGDSGGSGGSDAPDPNPDLSNS